MKNCQSRGETVLITFLKHLFLSQQILTMAVANIPLPTLAEIGAITASVTLMFDYLVGRCFVGDLKILSFACLSVGDWSIGMSLLPSLLRDCSDLRKV